MTLNRPLLAALLILGFVACRPEGEGPGSPELAAVDGSHPLQVASWAGGQLDPATYADWLSVHGLQPSAEHAGRLSLLLSLADAADRRGAAAEPEVVLAAEADRHRILLPVLDRWLDQRVEISDEKIEALRLERPGAFQQPRRLRLAGLFKRLPPDSDAQEALRRQVQGWRDAVDGGQPLGPLAAAESDSQNRYRDGQVGWVDPANLPSAVRDAVQTLEVGNVSAVIEHADGLGFYRLDEVRPAVRPTADEVRFKLRQNLFRQRRGEVNRVLNDALRARIEVDPSGDPVVRVGDHTLPADWVEVLAAQRIPDRSPDSLTPGETRRLLDEWARRVAMADEAERLELDREPVVSGALRWRHRNALAAAELRARVDQSLTTPDDRALQDLFAERGDRLREPERLRVAIIQFSRDARPGSATLATAREVVDGLEAGVLEFASAASAHSVHPSASQGGELPWATRAELGSLDVRLLQPLRRLTIGEDTGLIRAESGLWLARLLGREAARPMTFEAARNRLVKMHRAQQISRLEVEVQDQERDRMNLRLYPAATELPGLDSDGGDPGVRS